MKRLSYTRPHDINKLGEELLAALPRLRGKFFLEWLDRDIWVTVEDDVPTSEIDRVVNAHTVAARPPAPAPITTPEEEILAALPAAATVAQLSAALSIYFTRRRGTSRV